MIPRLLRHEKGIRTLVWLPIGLAAGLVLVALVRKPPGGLPFFPESFRPQYFVYPALYHWVYLAAFAVYAGVNSRGSRLYMALPLAAGTIWLTRVMAVVLGGLAIVAVQYGLLALVGLVQGGSLVDESLRSLALGLTSCYVLGVLLAQAPGATLAEVPFKPGYVVYLVAVWLVTLALVTLVSAYPYLVLLPLVLAALLLVRIRRSLPAALELISREPGAERAGGLPDSVRDRSGARGPGGWRSRTTGPRGALLRILYSAWLTPLLFIWLAFVGLRNAGYGFGGLSNTTMVVWALLALSGLMSFALPRLHMVDGLPVSRKMIFAYLVIPGLAVSLGSYTVGTVRAKGLFTGAHLVTYGAKYYDQQNDIRVPLEYWEISSGGSPAPVEGCCDEAHATWSTELVRGTGLILHSPYHVPEGSPPEVVARHLSRAIEDIFGTSIPPAELASRYFETDGAGGTSLKVNEMNLLEDYPGLRARGWLRTLPLVYLLVGLPWFAYLVLAMGPLRSSAPGQSLLRGHLVITFAAMGLLILMIWASGNGITKEYKVSAFAGIMLRKAAGTVPGGVASLWVLSLLLLAGAYLLARAAFLKYEFPVVRARGPFG